MQMHQYERERHLLEIKLSELQQVKRAENPGAGGWVRMSYVEAYMLAIEQPAYRLTSGLVREGKCRKMLPSATLCFNGLHGVSQLRAHQLCRLCGASAPQPRSCNRERVALHWRQALGLLP